MDLNFKGKAWVGNICQKFEAICQQVDGLVNQTHSDNCLIVKYVENQAQATGGAVGRGENNLSSSSVVVQGLVPPLVDPVKHEEQTAPQGQIDIVGIFAELMISTEEKAENTDIKQFSVEQVPNKDPMKDPPKDADKDVDGLIYKDTSMGVEQNVNISAEEISLTNELTFSIDLIHSEDKNLSEVFSEHSDSNFPQKEEEICCGPEDSVGLVNELSGALLPSESCSTLDRDKKDVDMGLAFSISALSLESNDGTRRTDEAVSFAGSYRHEHEQSWKRAQVEDVISPLEIGRVDGSGIDSEDGSMESIDLSDEENPDESCVVVDSRPVYAFTSRPRRFRSCKKIIQDAFTSRKRLAKEYEQLEILYGDVDGDPDENSILPSIATTLPSFKAKKSATEDSEWELV